MTEDQRQTDEAAETNQGVASPAEPEAGWKEILAAVFILLVMAGGVYWSWTRGYETGKLDGYDSAYEAIFPQLRRGAQAIRELDESRAFPGEARRFFVELAEGQMVTVTLSGGEVPGDSQVVEASGGDKVVISVAPGQAEPTP